MLFVNFIPFKLYEYIIVVIGLIGGGKKVRELE